MNKNMNLAYFMNKNENCAGLVNYKESCALAMNTDRNVVSKSYEQKRELCVPYDRLQWVDGNIHSE